MKKSLFTFVFILSLLFLLQSCDNNSTTRKNNTLNDSDKIADIDKTENVNENDFDQTDSSQDMDIVTENDLENQDDLTEQDSESQDEDNIENDFLHPNKGLNLYIKSVVIKMPQTQQVKQDQIPTLLQSELITKTGEKISDFKKDASSFSAEYETQGNKYLYINYNSGFKKNVAYTINAIIPYSTINWMNTNDVDTVSGTYFYIYGNKITYTSKTYTMCPAYIVTQKSDSFIKFLNLNKNIEIGDTFEMKLNTHLTSDTAKITHYFQKEDYLETCHCYSVVNGKIGSQKTCTNEDVDFSPSKPLVISPANGAENQTTDSTLKWSKSIDKDGGKVTYSLFFDTTNPPAKKVLSDSENQEFSPTLEKDKQYFWQVYAKDNEGNVTKSDVFTFNTNTTSETLPPHNFLIIANSNLKGISYIPFDIYMKDAKKQGYEVALKYWTPGSAEMLKQIIKKDYKQNNIKGVLLVGDLPAAWYEEVSKFSNTDKMYEQFPIDYFLMDMDGKWTDSDKNGLYDKRPEPLSIEIFTARVMGTPEEIKNYFLKAHDYKANGSFFKTRSFFSFIDDDWNGNSDTVNQKWNLDSIYNDNYTRLEKKDNTTKETYMDFMEKTGAEFVYQWIHSDPQDIYFNDNFSPNPANILKIDTLEKSEVKGSFFNLFDCSISRFTESEGNIATIYTHSKYGLATIGSTKVGGIFNPQIFHTSLSNGKSWGESYKDWTNDIFKNYKNYGFNEDFINSWWLGIMIQGDPLLQLTKSKVRSTIIKPKKIFYSKETQEFFNKQILKQAIKTKTHNFLNYQKTHPNFFLKK